MASFNDSRCESGGVDYTDPLFFTCELNEVGSMRLKLPTGYQESLTIGHTTDDIVLPVGYIVLSLIISEISTSKRNISITLSIVNAALLDGGEITCDDTTTRNVVMAACPLASEY